VQFDALVDQGPEGNGIIMTEVSHRESADADLHGVAVVDVAGVGNEGRHGFEFDTAVVPAAAGDVEEGVLVVGLPDNVDRTIPRQGEGNPGPDATALSAPGRRWALLTEQVQEHPDTAALVTPEAVPAAPDGVDVERRVSIIVKRTAVVTVAGPQFDPGTGPRLLELDLLLGRALGRFGGRMR
jgi:hypothetical protein